MNNDKITLKKIMVSFLIICTLCVIIRYIVLPMIVYPMRYKEQVFKSAKHHQVDPLLVFSIIKGESKFNPNAISRSGAKGLMQIMDKTGEWAAAELGLKEFTSDQLFDPQINIHIGCWYVAKLYNQYDGDIPTVLAAYNAGTGNVYKWRNNAEYSSDGIRIDYIPFGETRRYVKKIQKNLSFYHYLY